MARRQYNFKRGLSSAGRSIRLITGRTGVRIPQIPRRTTHRLYTGGSRPACANAMVLAGVEPRAGPEQLNSGSSGFVFHAPLEKRDRSPLFDTP